MAIRHISKGASKGISPTGFGQAEFPIPLDRRINAVEGVIYA